MDMILRPMVMATVLVWGTSAMADPAQEATQTARAMKAWYPSACEVKDADSTWADCAEHVVGYAQLLACAERALTLARAAEEKIGKEAKPAGGCGAEIARAVSSTVSAGRTSLAAEVAWLKKNRRRLEKLLKQRALAATCKASRSNCAGRPAHGAGFSEVSEIACTATVFRCGLDARDVCEVQKAAKRLGLCGAKRSSNKEDLLYVRATGERIVE